MRIPIVVAVLALSGASSVAAAAVPLVEAPEVPAVLVSVPSQRSAVFVVEPPLAPAMATVEKATATATAARVQVPAPALPVETYDAAPRFELLPDGALILSYDQAEPGASISREILLREPARAPAPDLAPKPLPRSAPLTSATDDTAPYALEIARGARALSTQPVATQGARVFDPRPTNVGTPAATFVAGGIALAALAGVGALLYHRIRPNAALENETRKLIFESVCATPGLGVHEISRIAGVSYSTATYHLERLVGAGMIVMTPDGNKLCYYKNGGAFSESERKILPLLKNEEAAKLFEAILHAPGTYRAALAEQLGVTATTINWHLRRLREAGLVDETRAGRSAHLYARVETLRPTFLALASKVEAAEPTTAERLRHYAGSAGGPTGPAAGAA